MLRKTTLAICSAFAGLLLVGTSYGQNDDGPNFVIVELFGCTYTANNDMSDLMEVADSWNEWADENGVTDYTAIVLTPYLYSPAFPYDVIWLGVYPTPEAMGAGEAMWFREGGELQADFDEVTECAVHAQYVGIPTNIPAGPANPDDGNPNLSAFQDCTLQNDRNVPEALAAHRQWGDFLAENGADVFMGALIPIAGENPDADYDYKAIVNFSSAEAYGNYLGTIMPGGLQRANQLFGRTTDCDTARVYVSTTVRQAAGNDD